MGISELYEKKLQTIVIMNWFLDPEYRISYIKSENVPYYNC
jgi:hypothetical protein